MQMTSFFMMTQRKLASIPMEEIFLMVTGLLGVELTEMSPRVGCLSRGKCPTLA